MTIIRAKLIPLSQALPGMVLESDVYNSNGQILIKAGMVLSASSLASLMKKNIGHVSVLAEDDRNEENLANERVKMRDHINFLFRNVAQDGTMGALRQIILEYRLEKLSS